MNFLRRNCRELLLLAALFVSFLIINPLIQELAPGAGALDWSFLTLLVAGLFKAVFIAVGVWLMLSIFMPTVSRFLDSGEFRTAFLSRCPEEKLIITAVSILTFLTLLTVCVLFG